MTPSVFAHRRESQTADIARPLSGRTLSVALDAAHFKRDTNIQNFKLDSFEVVVSFVLTLCSKRC